MKPLFIFLSFLCIVNKSSACTVNISYTLAAPGLVNFTSTVHGCSATATYTYKWYFGDGDTSILANPIHIYSGYGPYIVTVSAICSDFPSFVATASATISDMTISGKIVGDGIHAFSLKDTFRVFLLTYDTLKKNYIVNMTDAADSSTHYKYSFKAVSPNSYVIKTATINDTKINEGWTCTYGDSSIFWNSATNIYVDRVGFFSQNIYMQYSMPATGSASITGKIIYGVGVPGHLEGDVIAGLQVYLLNSSGQLVTRTLTGADGTYSLGNLLARNYSVYPENTGYIITPWNSIYVSDPTATITNINFIQSSTTITPNPTTIVPTTIITKEITIYPNPANNLITLQYSSAAPFNREIIISNIAGQKLLQTTLNSDGKSILNVSQLNNGIYFIHVNSAEGSVTEKLIIQH